MPRLKKLTKREVLATDVGKAIGRPADILVDPNSHKVSLILMTEGATPEMSVVIPASAVSNFDVDALTIESMTKAHLAIHDRAILSNLEAGLKLRKRPIFTKDGLRLGKIDGIEVDSAGNVTAYRVRKPRLGRFRPKLQLSPSEVGGLGSDVAIATPSDPPPPADGGPYASKQSA
jgi:uncharacterized protein YrrD